MPSSKKYHSKHTDFFNRQSSKLCFKYYISFNPHVIAEQNVTCCILKEKQNKELNFMMGYYLAFIFRNFKCIHTKVYHFVFFKYYQWLFFLPTFIAFHTWKRLTQMYHATLCMLATFVCFFFWCLYSKNQKQFKIHGFGEIQVRHSRLLVDFCPEIEITVTHFKKQFSQLHKYLVVKNNMDTIVKPIFSVWRDPF